MTALLDFIAQLATDAGNPQVSGWRRVTVDFERVVTNGSYVDIDTWVGPDRKPGISMYVFSPAANTTIQWLPYQRF